MGITRATKNVINYREIVDITMKDADIVGINQRADAADRKNLEQEIRLNYLEGRQNSSSTIMSELYLDESKTDLTYLNDEKPAEIMDDNDWNNNWKETQLPSPVYKNGYMRPRQIPYMLENMDEYNLLDILNGDMGGMSRYDSQNDCYWIISNQGGSNTQGEITQISPKLKDGKIEVLRRWMLPAHALKTWSGIDFYYLDSVTTYVIAVAQGTATTTSILHGWAYKHYLAGYPQYSYVMGTSNAQNGDTLAPYLLYLTGTMAIGSPTIATANTASLRVGMWISGTGITSWQQITAINSATTFTISAPCISPAGTQALGYYDNNGALYISNSSPDIGYYNDVVEYDTTSYAVLTCNGTSAVNLIRRDKNNWSIISAILGFEKFVGGSTSVQRSITKSGNNIYIRVNDAVDNKRFIYKFNITTDIISGVAVTCSGRYELSRDIDDRYASATNAAPGGIGVSKEGDILEVTSTLNNGRFISRRAVKNALIAENQVTGVTKPLGALGAAQPYGPSACMVDTDGNYWTGDYYVWVGYVPNNTARLYRYKKSTGAVTSVTFTNVGGGVNAIIDACHDGTSVYIVFYYGTGAIYRIAKGPLSTLLAGILPSSIAIGSGGWSYLTFPSAANTAPIYGLAYDSDAGVLLATLSTNYIATIPTDGSSFNTTSYKLPAPTNNWWGCAYKNGNIYVNEMTFAATPCRVSVFVKSKMTSTTWFRSHIYQDPQDSFASNYYNQGRYGIDFDGNDLISISYTAKVFTKHATLVDPDVMQLHTFIDGNNILPTSTVCSATPIVERYFEPNEFSDPRDVPDKNYMVLGYGKVSTTYGGFSELHLDEYLSDKSITGKDRYDVSKIRTRHYLGVATSPNNIVGYYTGWNGGVPSTTSVFVDRDMIFASIWNPGGTSDSGPTVYMIDLLKSKAFCFGSAFNVSYGRASYWGARYNGNLSQRNDNLGYNMSSSPELALNTNGNAYHYISYVHARTFTKDDISDYSLESPRTYVSINHTLGNDILVITWDSSNNRIPIRTWTNVFNAAAIGGGTFHVAANSIITQSGYLFAAWYTAYGTMKRGLNYIWNLAENLGYDNANAQKCITYATSNYLSTYQSYISPNSLCWKTPSGLWRHIITIAISEGQGIMVYDCENNTRMDVCYRPVGSTGHSFIDNYEDRIFYIEANASSAGYLNAMATMKRLHFDDKYQHGGPGGNTDIVDYNGWHAQDYIHYATRPRFGLPFRWINGDGLKYQHKMVYSPLVNKLNFSSHLYGTCLYHYYYEEQSTHKSIEFEMDSPSKYVYKKTLRN